MARHNFDYQGATYQIDDTDGSIYDPSGAMLDLPPGNPLRTAAFASIYKSPSSVLGNVPVVGGIVNAITGGGAPPPPATGAITPQAATAVPVNPNVSQPTPALAVGTPYDDIVTEWAKAHGGIASGPSWVIVGKTDAKGQPTDPAEQRDHYRQYQFSDGSRLVINGSGQVNEENSADTSGRNRVLGDLTSKYGQPVGQGTIDTERSQPGEKHPFYTYTFRDQNGRITTVSVNDNGQVAGLKEAAAPPGTSLVSSRQTAADGTVTETFWDRSADGKLSPSALPPTVTKGDKSWSGSGWVEQPDGSKVLMGFDPADNVYKRVPGAPNVPAGPPGSVVNTTTYDAQGRKVNTPMVYDPQTRGFVPAPGLQPSVEPTGAPASPDKWVPVYRTPGDPKSGTIGFQDPGSREFHPVQGSQPITWEDSRGARYAWDGNMEHKPVQLQGGTKGAVTPFPGASSDQLNLTYTDANGNVVQQPNQSFIPKTPTEFAARVGSLQQAARAKSDQLQQQYQAGTITKDQRDAQFGDWWNANVESQRATLQTAQQQTTAEEQRKQQEQQRLNFATAQTAGQNAVQAYQATLPNRVGPGFGAALNSILNSFSTGKAPPQLDYSSAVTYQMPDLNQLAEQATAQALAHISPTAAGIAGQAMPQTPQLDLSSALDRTSYAPTVTVSPTGAVTVQHAAPAAVQTRPAPSPNWGPPPGQNYPASVAYTGGIAPPNALPGPSFQNYQNVGTPAVSPEQFGTFQLPG